MCAVTPPESCRMRLVPANDLKHPLVVLAARLPWSAIEAALAPK